MKASELRIGNWVYIGRTMNVTNMDSMGINRFHDGYEEYTPIPLSEDWLKRLGFRKQKIRGEVWCWRTEHFALSSHSVKERDLYLYGYGLDSEPVKYVHQLQNLYHSLTGEELTLSDDLSDLEKFTHENIFKSLNT